MTEKKDSTAAPEDKPRAAEKKVLAEDPGIFPVETLAGEAKVPAWELAGLRKAKGWAEGKQVSAEDFGRALGAFRKRPQGGGI